MVQTWDFEAVDRISHALDRATFLAAGTARGDAQGQGGIWWPWGMRKWRYDNAAWSTQRLSDRVRAFRIALKRYRNREGTTESFTRLLIAQRDMSRDMASCDFGPDVHRRVVALNGMIEELRPYYPANEWKYTGAVQ